MDGASIFPMVYPDSTNRLWLAGDDVDAFNTFAVVNFTGGSAVLDGHVVGPLVTGDFPSSIPVCSIYDAVNDLIISVTRATAFVPNFPGTLTYEVRLCFFTPSTGAFTSILLQGPAAGIPVIGGVIVKCRSKYALLYAASGFSSGVTSLYIIDPVTRTIVSTTSLTSNPDWVFNSNFTYCCPVNRLILNYLDLSASPPPFPHPNFFLVVNPDIPDLSGDTYQANGVSANWSEIVYIDSSELVLGYTGNLTVNSAFFTWNPLDGTNYNTLATFGNLEPPYSSIGLPQGLLYDFKSDQIVLPVRNYDLVGAESGRGQVWFWNAQSGNVDCVTNRPEWPDPNFGSEEYPAMICARSSDGRVYAKDTNAVDDFVLELQP